MIENTLERQFSHFSYAYVSCAVEHGILLGAEKMFYLLTGCTDGINLSVIQLCRVDSIMFTVTLIVRAAGGHIKEFLVY